MCFSSRFLTFNICFLFVLCDLKQAPGAYFFIASSSMIYTVLSFQFCKIFKYFPVSQVFLKHALIISKQAISKENYSS